MFFFIQEINKITFSTGMLITRRQAIIHTGARELAQNLRALAALSEGPGSTPNNHILAQNHL